MARASHRSVVTQTDFPGWPVRRGKVRDIYDLGDRLLMVSTDRLSAFDWVLPTPIPDKGRVLTQLSAFWFQQLDVPHHLLTLDVHTVALPAAEDYALLEGRTMIVRKAEVLPVECVVRGYLDGSAWNEYQRSGSVCGLPLPAGLVHCDRLAQPIFTPATKESSGHDINITFEQMRAIVGSQTAEALRAQSIELYVRGAQFARPQGILIADTKFEWGRAEGELILIDEALTPDSSRFWPLDQYQPGHSQPSFDKQFVRDYLETTSWDKQSPPPPLPAAIVASTRAKYLEAFQRLTGQALDG